MNPSSFRPAQWSDLIGHAALTGQRITAKLARLDRRTDTVRLLFAGVPGCGKSTLARLAAQQLAGSADGARFAIETISGPRLDAETVKGWHDARGLSCLWGDWRIKVIEEADKVPAIAQVLMLDYLDQLTPGTAILATSNRESAELNERFQTRFQFFEVKPPDTEAITALLTRLCPSLPHFSRKMIAVGSGGNVRAALLDAETALDAELLAA